MTVGREPDQLLPLEAHRALATAPPMRGSILSVVVLPAPLRPRGVTTSPSATSKSMPGDVRLAVPRVEAFHLEQARHAGSEIGLDHLGRLGDVFSRLRRGSRRAGARGSDPNSVDTSDRLCSTISNVHWPRHASPSGDALLTSAVRHAGGRLIEAASAPDRAQSVVAISSARLRHSELDRHGVLDSESPTRR